MDSQNETNKQTKQNQNKTHTTHTHTQPTNYQTIHSFILSIKNTNVYLFVLFCLVQLSTKQTNKQTDQGEIGKSSSA